MFAEKKFVKAMDGVSLSVKKGQTIGIVGESGCGKSTLAKTLMHLETPTAGKIFVRGKESQELAPSDYRHFIQMIFQDPYSSVNPRKKAWQIIGAPLMISQNQGGLDHHEIKNRAIQMMEKVGLRSELADRYPHMFSGGQRQRLGIARALMLRPSVLICDEPVSALDVSIQAQVLNLLVDLQNEYGLTYLFISHDLSVVNHLCDTIAVMYLGKIVEFGPREEVLYEPKHPYTQALIESSPNLQKDSSAYRPLEGELPSPIDPPSGCSFNKRCPRRFEGCDTKTPELKKEGDSLVSCFLYQ